MLREYFFMNLMCVYCEAAVSMGDDADGRVAAVSRLPRLILVCPRALPFAPHLRPSPPGQSASRRQDPIDIVHVRRQSVRKALGFSSAGLCVQAISDPRPLLTLGVLAPRGYPGLRRTMPEKAFSWYSAEPVVGKARTTTSRPAHRLVRGTARRTAARRSADGPAIRNAVRLRSSRLPPGGWLVR